MRRRLFNLLSLLSLLLCVLAAALWVRSYRVIDQLTYVGGRSRCILTTAGGGLDAAFTIDDLFEQVPQGWRWRHQPDAGNARAVWRVSVTSPQNPFTQQPVRTPRLGFWWGTQNDLDPNCPTPVHHVLFMAPLWFLTLPWAALPLVWVARRYQRAQRQRRQDRGRCPRCCYDLRATPDRCPECGASPVADTAPIRAAPHAPPGTAP